MARDFRLLMPMHQGSEARETFGSLLRLRGLDVPMTSARQASGSLVDLWLRNDHVCSLLLLDAHDGWSNLADRKREFAFELELELRGDGLRPIQVRADKGAIPLLALDQAIARRRRGMSLDLDELFAFHGRWAARNLEIPAPAPRP